MHTFNIQIEINNPWCLYDVARFSFLRCENRELRIEDRLEMEVLDGERGEGQIND